MTPITATQLKAIMPYATSTNLLKFQPALQTACERFQIDTPQRMGMFLAQIGHESGSLHYVLELASGKAYEGRKDLGNIAPGDGVRYKGRGLIQITGKHNYDLCGQSLGLPLLEKPELLEQPLNAALSAAWFWNSNKLNAYADQGLFDVISRKINGGTNGQAERRAMWERAKEALNIT